MYSRAQTTSLTTGLNLVHGEEVVAKVYFQERDNIQDWCPRGVQDWYATSIGTFKGGKIGVLCLLELLRGKDWCAIYAYWNF